MSMLDRRAVLTGAAAAIPAAAVATVPVLASPDDDPAFAVIEGFRRAWEGMDEPTAALDRIDEDDPRLAEFYRAADAADDAVSDAEDQFILKQPTTIAGVAAVLRFAGEHAAESGNEIWESRHRFENSAGDVSSFDVAFFLTLADSLERIVDGRPIESGLLRRCDEEEEDHEPEVVVTQEPPEPWTRDEEIAAHRRILDHCTAKIAELEATGVTGASHV